MPWRKAHPPSGPRSLFEVPRSGSIGTFRPSRNPLLPLEGAMKKFKLQLDDLLIDSFSTTPVRKGKGTVFGEQCTCPTACTCPGCPTCDASCNGSCGGGSCIDTCAAS